MESFHGAQYLAVQCGMGNEYLYNRLEATWKAQLQLLCCVFTSVCPFCHRAPGSCVLWG